MHGHRLSWERNHPGREHSNMDVNGSNGIQTGGIPANNVNNNKNNNNNQTRNSIIHQIPNQKYVKANNCIMYDLIDIIVAKLNAMKHLIKNWMKNQNINYVLQNDIELIKKTINKYHNQYVICKNWKKYGKCNYGEYCWYSHPIFNNNNNNDNYDNGNNNNNNDNLIFKIILIIIIVIAAI